MSTESSILRSQANSDFDHARALAGREELKAMLTRRPIDLLPFGEVRQALHLLQVRHVGIRQVPLEHIIGSEQRANDFTRSFMPRSDSLRERWIRINMLARIRGLPPIEVFQVDQIYFVRDGNHRVSVSRFNKTPDVQAHVWEYPTRIPLDADLRLTDLPLKRAHLAFLEYTGLDQLRPGQQIEFTQPERYRILEEHIISHAHWLRSQHEGNISPTEITISWYDRVYTPLIELIRRHHLREDFPDYTEADLYVLLMAHRDNLVKQSGHPISMDEVIQDYRARFGKWHTRLSRKLQHLIQRG